ncbi:MAG: CDP-alcohol phosphatidyltransferase family protein [Acidimicrobiales bacterium]|jgi:CDP-diacylglycerol--glycerol-3-phosphate 3-phosphatidyltransferase
MFDGRWRDAVDRSTTPVGRSLHRCGISADVLTAAGLVSAVATAVAVASGHLLLAVPLLLLTGLHDLLDGPVAKAGGTASVRGAFFDSVTDRVSDAVLMGGVSWYLISTHRGHLALLPFGVLAMASIVSYQRAKAESLGLSAKGGLMERAERMILLGVGFLASWLLVPVLWVLLGLVTLTAIGRFARVWQIAEGPTRVKRPAEAPSEVSLSDEELSGTDREDRELSRIAILVGRSRWKDARGDSRWSGWKEGAWFKTAGSRDDEPLARWRARRREALLNRPERAPRTRRRAQGRHVRTRRTTDPGGRRS